LILRQGQQKLKAAITAAWAAGHQNVLAVKPTGGGKTCVFSSIVHDEPDEAVVIAHRVELVGQISMALAREEVFHRLVCSDDLVKDLNKQHIEEFGRSYYSASAKIGVASVDTLASNKPEWKAWSLRIKLWVMDEGHHLLKENKWGKAVAMFPNARGLAVTATPCRLDGKGLGRDSHGLMDVMVLGSTVNELIAQGYLSRYRIFVPPSDFDATDIKTTASGEFSPKMVDERVKKSHIFGDVVRHYIERASGKLGITFAHSVQAAEAIAKAFNEAGVPAVVITSKTKARLRKKYLRDARLGKLRQLVNVDLFDEGFDLPAIEVVSMARLTNSLSKVMQQIGRALRPMEGKDYAIILDHVGNIARHGLPDKQRMWSLDPRYIRAKKDPNELPLRVCASCTQPFEAYSKECPYCGYKPVPALREDPDTVEGDLTELTSESLDSLRADIAKVDRSAEAIKQGLLHAGKGGVIASAAAKNQRHRQSAQSLLRESMAAWSGCQTLPMTEQHIKFWNVFGVDALTAQALGKTEALKLAVTINSSIGRILE